jgi:histidine triad (HIT) family protein
MASVFSKIVAGEIPAWKVAENGEFLAFLDISPLTIGHTLVIPKNEVDYLFDIDSEEYSRLLLFARKVALGLKEAVQCKRVGVAVLGMEVPHAHIHLVPLNKESDMDLSKPKLKPERSEMEQIAKLISSKIKL